MVRKSIYGNDVIEYRQINTLGKRVTRFSLVFALLLSLVLRQGENLCKLIEGRGKRAKYINK